MHQTFPKDPKGTFKRQRTKKRRTADADERSKKDRAKLRDGFRCRKPRCTSVTLLHSAHWKHKGAGGNPAMDRTQVDELISFCANDHDAFDKRKTLRVKMLTPRKADGPIEVHEKINGVWVCLGISWPATGERGI